MTWRRSALSLGGRRFPQERHVTVLCGRVGAQSSDGVEKLPAVPDNADAKILQVFRRQVRQDHVVDCVLAEHRLILSKAKAPQPTTDVHNGSPNSAWWA